KKAVKTDSEEDELDDLVEDLLGDEQIERVYPKLEETKKKESIPPSEEEIIEEEEFELEEEPRFPDYKYLNLEITKGQSENDYELTIEGQSHGFCNIFVKHLLKTEGVNIAAYKATNIEPAKIFIRLENSKPYKIKDILHKSIESLREEVIGVQKLFKKLM
ncbi:MAG: RpoL/Rpb11 RNA polymerase subunit family protein, partial [Candidatus Hodarchaeota archaeon]